MDVAEPFLDPLVSNLDGVRADSNVFPLLCTGEGLVLCRGELTRELVEGVVVEEAIATEGDDDDDDDDDEAMEGEGEDREAGVKGELGDKRLKGRG